MTAAPTVLSGSSLNTFLECPKEWEYIYVWALRRPPSYKMALGTAAHYAVEIAMKERLASGSYPPLDVWQDAFMEMWGTEAAETKPSKDTYEESESAHVESGLRCIAFFRTKVAPTIIPKHVEWPISFNVNDVFIWTGVLDLVEEVTPITDGLVDWKFTAKRPDKDKYRWPRVGYSIGYRQKTGAIEAGSRFHYIIRNKTPIDHIVESGPATQDDINELVAEATYAMSEIRAGNFPALGPTTGACNWCRYVIECPSALPRVKERRIAEARARRPK